jgi:hypothetical protein
MIARQPQSVSCSVFVSPLQGDRIGQQHLGGPKKGLTCRERTLHRCISRLHFLYILFLAHTQLPLYRQHHIRKKLAGRDQKDHRQPVPANVMQRKNPRQGGQACCSSLRHVVRPWRTMVWSNSLKSQFLSTLLTAPCSPASVCTASAQKPGSPYPWGRPHHLLLCHSFPCVLKLQSPHP